jgi:hypothetical protein
MAESARPYTKRRMRPRRKTDKDFKDLPPQAQHIAVE